MVKFESFFINPFSDRKISLTEELSYAAANLSAMVANNPGALLNQRITATTTALAALESGTTDTLTKVAIQKGQTQAKDEFRKALPGNIARVHAAVAAAFGEPSPQLTTAFPQGRRAFATCRDEQVDNLLGQLLAVLTPLATQVGQAHVDNVGGLLSTWTAIYAAQGAAKDTTKGSKAGVKDLRGALELELFKNLLTLALAFPEQPEKAALYCPQSLLVNRDTRPTIGPATLAAGPYDAVLRQVALTMTATGAESFVLRRRLSSATDWETVASGIEPMDGTGSFVDTVPAPGQYVYEASGVVRDFQGPASSVVSVTAT